MTSAPLTPPPFPDPNQKPGYVPTPEVAPARLQLRRSGTDRMAGGVCGGLADYTGIDSLLWRVGFVGLTLAGGSGLVVYLLLWVLVPSAPLPPDTWPSPVERLVQRLHGAIPDNLTGSRRD